MALLTVAPRNCRVVVPGGSVVGPLGLSAALYWFEANLMVVVAGLSTTVAPPVFCSCTVKVAVVVLLTWSGLSASPATFAMTAGATTCTGLPVSGTVCAKGAPFSVPCAFTVTGYEPAVNAIGTAFDRKLRV